MAAQQSQAEAALTNGANVDRERVVAAITGAPFGTDQDADDR